MQITYSEGVKNGLRTKSQLVIFFPKGHPYPIEVEQQKSI